MKTITQSKLTKMLEKHALDSRLFAKSVGISNDKIDAILLGERIATEEESTAIMVALTVIGRRGWDYWYRLSMSQESNELLAKFVAGSCILTIGGIIAISACGIPGLILDGWAAIRAFVIRSLEEKGFIVPLFLLALGLFSFLKGKATRSTNVPRGLRKLN